MMTTENYQQLVDLRRAHDEENETINQAIDNYFAICDIAKKEFIEKSDWALENVHRLQEKREILHKEYINKVEAINNKCKEESA